MNRHAPAFDPERRGRRVLSAAAAAALEAVRPETAVSNALDREGRRLRGDDFEFDLDAFDRVVVLAFGKGAVGMARAVLPLLEGSEFDGFVVAPAVEDVHGLSVVLGTHPVPSDESRQAGTAVLRRARLVGPRDLALVLVSGGASSLCEVPSEGIDLSDVRAVTHALLRSGASIQDINVVRKHLSAFKGGRLAMAMQQTGGLLTLVMSDVVGNPLDVIASGPTVPDTTTFADALETLARFGILDGAPRSVVEHLRAGVAGDRAETPSGGSIFERQVVRIVADGPLAARAARDSLRQDGFRAEVLDARLEGDVGEVARRLAQDARRLDRGQACVYAGETSVSIKGQGVGGRNQELALHVATAIEHEPDLLALALGTDGVDGMSDAAGAIVDAGTVGRGRDAGLSAVGHLGRNDSDPFLKASGDQIRTGPTGTNVGDVLVVLREA